MAANTVGAPTALVAPLFGTPFDDILAATADGQCVDGLGGSDRISSAFNMTTLIGGSGNDRLRTALEGTDEHLVATQRGGSGNDFLFASVVVVEPAFDASFFLRGGGGDDRIVASMTNQWFADVFNDIRGGAGNDWITATADDYGGESEHALNRIWGDDGDDRIESTVAVGPTTGEFARNEVDGGSGRDTIALSTLVGTNVGTDDVISLAWGRDGNDRITVNQTVGDNYGENRAEVRAGAGNDVVVQTITASGADSPVAASGYVEGGSGRDRLTSRVSLEEVGEFATVRNTVDGGEGNDVLRAFSFVDGMNAEVIQIVHGRQGNDKLIALSGSRLHGGIGNDRSIGSAEADAFMFAFTGVSHGGDLVEQFDRTADILALDGFDGNVTVTDAGADVLAEFANGASILFKGVGTGAVDSLLDLVDDPGQIITDWSLLS